MEETPVNQHEPSQPEQGPDREQASRWRAQRLGCLAVGIAYLLVFYVGSRVSPENDESITLVAMLLLLVAAVASRLIRGHWGFLRGVGSGFVAMFLILVGMLLLLLGMCYFGG